MFRRRAYPPMKAKADAEREAQRIAAEVAEQKAEETGQQVSLTLPQIQAAADL